MAQRISRAKQRIKASGVPFCMPTGQDRTERLSAVLHILYLIFNEGYAATVGDDLIRPALCLEAQRLGRMLAGLMPDDAEVFGLLALMENRALLAAQQRRQLGHAAENVRRACSPQCAAVVQRCIGEHRGASGHASRHARHRIFHHGTAGGECLQRGGGDQVHIGRGLGGGHFVAAENTAVKEGGQAHLGQLHFDLEPVGT